MRNGMSSIVRAVLRNRVENIFYLGYDGLFEQQLSGLPYQFYTTIGDNTDGTPNKICQYEWYNDTPIPKNFINVQHHPTRSMPSVDFDLVMCNSSGEQYKIAKRISDAYHIPLLLLEHECPENFMNRAYKTQYQNTLPKDNHYFTHSFLQKEWIQPEIPLIKYDIIVKEPTEETNDILVVGNFTQGDCVAISQIAEIGNVKVIGNNPGFSKPQEFLDVLQSIANCRIFLNIGSRTRPPFWMMYAMMAGKPVISNDTQWSRALGVEVICEQVKDVKAGIQQILRNPEWELSLKNVRPKFPETSVDIEKAIRLAGNSLYVRKN